MGRKINDVRKVTFSKDFGRYRKGEHAMHVRVAEKLEKRGAPVKVEEYPFKQVESKKRKEALKTKDAK